MVYKLLMDMLTGEQDGPTASVPATALGFHVAVEEPLPPVPATIPDTELLLQAAAPAERENLLSDLIKQNSLYTTYLMQRQLSEEGLDPTTPRGQRINIMDQMAKLSGLSAKQAAKEVGAAVSITINMPHRKPKPITFEGAVIDVADADSETRD